MQQSLKETNNTIPSVGVLMCLA